MTKIKKILILLLSIFLISIVAACSNDHEAMEGDDHEVEGEGHNETEDSEGHGDNHNASSEIVTNGLLHLNTKNITRLNSEDPFEVAVLTSQTIWPATHEANQPGTIMLAPLENWQLALASLNLVHHPNDGPLLFTPNGEIPSLIMSEIERLNPKGNVDGTEIMVIGHLEAAALEQLAHYNVIHINEEDPAALAYEIDDIYSQLINNVPSSVIIGSLEESAKHYTIPAGSWITHMDESILFVTENGVPDETIAALEKRNGNATMYLIGPETVISEQVALQLEQFGNVVRIDGETPEQVSIEFAKFKDHETGFGWGVNKPGHGLVMVSTEVPELAITAAPFAHLGKHAPMVWLHDGVFTGTMHEYLELLKPMFEHDPTEGPYNHGYLIGNEALVSFQVQGYIDEMLEIVPASGGGHGDHGAHGGHNH